MKRLLLLSLIFVFPLLAQVPTSTSRIPLTVPPVYVGQFNGTSQYFSKTSPSKMDLNGSELITDPGFESGVTGWTVTNGAASQSTARKRTGTYSMLVLADGVGTMPVNYTTQSNTSTNKFTAEGFVYLPATNTSKTVRVSIRNQGGTEIATSGAAVVTADTWVKLVVNGQLPGTQTGIQHAVILSGPAANDSLYIDDVSLTQAYDGVIAGWVDPNSTSKLTVISNRGSGSSNFWMVEKNTTNYEFRMLLNQGSGADVVATTGTLADPGRLVFVAFTVNRTGDMTPYHNGTAYSATSITAVGKLTNTEPLQVGTILLGTNPWSGLIGEHIVVRYPSLPSGIASWIAYVNTQRYIPEPPGGGETVLRIFGRRNDAYDQSGNQGVLTNTGSTPIIQKQ